MVLLLFLSLVQWQQRFSYDIDARLDTRDQSLTAVATLTYANNSPRALDTLYILVGPEAPPQSFVSVPYYGLQGIRVDRITSASESLEFCVDEGLLGLALSPALAPGDSIRLRIDYSLSGLEGTRWPFGLPGHYEMEHWYPMVCPFDEAGWHVGAVGRPGDGKRAFGDYDVTIDLPESYVIAATGTQTEPVPEERADVAVPSRKRVRFTAASVQGFAWVCDSTFEVRECDVDGATVRIFFRGKNESGYQNSLVYARDVLTRYGAWFGACPHRELNIIDGARGQTRALPRIMIIGQPEDRLTRLFEVSIASGIGDQYFGASVPWLADGLCAYATARYVEDKYGRSNSLIKTTLVPALSPKYLYRFLYYVAHTNGLERPLAQAWSGQSDLSIGYFSIARAKGALLLFSLEDLLGRDAFLDIVREYNAGHAAQRLGPERFIAMCEDASDLDLHPLFDAFLNTTRSCDWVVGPVTGRSARIENRGDLMLPVRVRVRTSAAECDLILDGREKTYTIGSPCDSGDILEVAVDPSQSTLDQDHWNNYFPRRVSVKPVWDLDWPSFSTYQILWAPYLWYSSYDGVKAGIYIFGDKFADVDIIKGGFQTVAGYVRGFASKRDYPQLICTTPLVFEEALRVRLRFSGSRSQGGDNISIGFLSSIGRFFERGPRIEVTNMLSYGGLFTYQGVDSIDWELGKNACLENRIRFRYLGFDVDAGLAFAHRYLGGDWQYVKPTLELKRSFEYTVPFTVRLYAARIFGTAPRHEQLFLSGALRTSMLGGLLFGQRGSCSPQERFHVQGDGNMRGFQTLHIRSDEIYVMNMEVPARSIVRLFSDVGYYGRFAFDAGLCLVIDSQTLPWVPVPGLNIGFNLPLYTYLEGEPWNEPWRLYWSFSL